MDIDVNPFPSEDPILMLRRITVAFMLTLAKQPNMMLEFTVKTMKTFPYECFRISSSTDPKTGAITFLLIPEENCEVSH